RIDRLALLVHHIVELAMDIAMADCPVFVRIADNPDKSGRQPDAERCNRTRMRRGGVGRVLAMPVGMSLPREGIPSQFYMITRRCQQRQFLMRPDEATNNAFTYCLIEAAQRCQIEVLLPCAMSNHYHAVIFDRCGRYPEFAEHFHKMFARSQ